MDYSTFFVKFVVEVHGLRVHGFELGVHVTWFRQYGVPCFESTGYIVR